MKRVPASRTRRTPRGVERPDRELAVKELGPRTWPAFFRLFEKHRGVWGGCWCDFYHVDRGWEGRTSEVNRADKERRVRQGESHGILVFDGAVPVGWCQFGSREELPRIDRMRSYPAAGVAPGDWRITCFFVDKDSRKRGVAQRALRGVLEAVAARGGGLVEAYPNEPTRTTTPVPFMWNGTLAMFERTGFVRKARLGKSRWLVQRRVEAAAG